MSIEVIEGYLVYAKISQDAFKYQSDTDKEYSVGVIFDEDAADLWNDKFLKQPAKKIKVSDFEAKFKFECPIKDVKNVYVINLKKSSIQGGIVQDEQYRPKVFLDAADGTRTEITTSRLIANGTYAKVSYYVSENDKYGLLSRLQNVLIKEAQFIEYEQKEGSVAGSEFKGDSPKASVKEAASKGATEARDEKPRNVVKPKPKTMSVDEFDNSDSPF